VNALDTLLIIALLTAVVTFVMGNRPAAGWTATLLYAVQLAVLLSVAGLVYGNGGDGTSIESALTFQVLGNHLHWRFDALSWFFASITLGAALLCSWFASGSWAQDYRDTGGSLRLFNSAIALNVFAMLLLLASGDFLTLFIGWEAVSWASFLLMAISGPRATRYALRYLTYAIGGAMAVLMALAIVHTEVGSFEFNALQAAMPSLADATVWWLLLLFGAGFAVKMALVPFHLWQAKAYAETPGPGAAFLGAISSRMGLFAILLVLVQLIGLGRLLELKVPFDVLSARDVLAWIAVLTIIFPTYTALRQHDARRLLAWSGIGQGGYMLLGIVTGDDLGTAGGLMHVFNYACYEALLFLVVTAVVFRTGTADMNKLGGLVARMPLSFFAMLIAIISLAGLPPMAGFVSKWLIYRSLIIDGSPFLFLGTVIGTLGTILYVYKLIHNIFLGQLRVEHVDVEEAPWSMLVPMLILSAMIFVTGYFPGLVLEWVSAVQAVAGLPVLEHTLGGVPMEKGGLDMIWVVSVMLAGFGIGTLIFLAGGRSRRVHQLDNYAGGHFLTAETRYQYSDNFYPGLMHLIGPWYRKSFRWAERGLVSAVDASALAMQALYRQTHPSFFLLAVVVIALAWVIV
jgi:NADH-quinone oxidoreductase subunit M